MRFCIELKTINEGKSLPINYQYELSSWIYKCIHYGNPEFAKWLHETGYNTGTQRFKFFTFSNLIFSKDDFAVKGDRLILKSGRCKLVISFLLPEAAGPFIQGIFIKQHFGLGDQLSQVDFLVSAVERIADPELKNTMTFNTLSPVVIGKSRIEYGGKGTEYLSPAADDYSHYFFQNLKRKAEVLNALPGQKTPDSDALECSLELLNEPKSKLVLIKSGKDQQTKVKGYLFSFRLTAPIELMKIALDAGVGEKNSLGMGSVEIK